MSVPQPSPVPLTIAGRSPLDGVRFRWGGVGDIVLGIACIGAIGGAGGILFGIVLIALGIATWRLTRFGSLPWYAMPTRARIIAAAGSIAGNAFLYIFFCYLFVLWMLVKHIILPVLRG